MFPPNRQSTKSSKAWNFGGFRKDKSKQLVKDVTICGICGKNQKYRNTPTNLQQHAQAEYPNEWNEGVNNSKLKDTTVKDNPKQTEFDKIITEWIIKSKRPLKIVEDSKLVEAFQLSDPKLSVPSRFKVKSAVQKIYEKKKTELIKELKNVA